MGSERVGHDWATNFHFSILNSTGALFPKASAHFMSVWHILVILIIFQAFSSLLYLSWWSVIRDQLHYCKHITIHRRLGWWLVFFKNKALFNQGRYIVFFRQNAIETEWDPVGLLGTKTFLCPLSWLPNDMIKQLLIREGRRCRDKGGAVRKQ